MNPCNSCEKELMSKLAKIERHNLILIDHQYTEHEIIKMLFEKIRNIELVCKIIFGSIVIEILYFIAMYIKSHLLY